MRSRWPLAARMTIWYALSAVVLMAAATTYLYLRLARELDREDEQLVLDRLAEVTTLLRAEPRNEAELMREIGREWQPPHGNRIVMRVLDSEGKVRGQTRDLTFLFQDPVAGGSSSGGVSPKTREARSSTGALFLEAEARVAAPADASTWWIQVAVDRSDDEELLAKVRIQIFAVLGATVLLSGGLGYGLARRGLRPLSEIADAARRIRGPDIAERVDVSAMPGELADLGTTLNAMLDRLEGAFGRISRFSADIAHELRTPVNSLRGRVEVSLGKARTAEEYRAVLEATLDECEHLGRLIDRLLFLARAENPDAKIERETVSVAKELRAIAEFFEPAAQDIGVGLVVESEEDLCAGLDRTLINRALGNLVANSLAHTGRGGTVRLAGHRRDGQLRLSVADDGEGIPAEHVPHVFDRFYRVDSARSAPRGGTGLGLAIVRSIAVLHGGTASIESEPGRGTMVNLDLPYGDDA